MPVVLVPETGAGLPGANSYASLADFEAYAGGHMYATAWTAANDEARSVALIHATRLINIFSRFRGQALVEGQGLDWPRYYTAEAPAPPVAVPARLRDATCELALDLLVNNRLAEPAEQGIKKLGLGQGALEIEFNPGDRKQPLPLLVREMLAPLLEFASGSAGLAKVRRVI